MARNTNGAALRCIRELAGVKQKDLAAILGIRPGTMSQVESGRSNLHPEKLRKAADYLGIPINAISSVVPEPEEIAS